jgi:hypothetical protein
MSDEHGPGDGAQPGSGAQPDTWDELGQQLRELGGAIVAAVKAAADDPENRRRAQEFRASLDSIVGDIDDAVSDAARSEHGQRVKDAADAVASAGRKVAEDVRPHLIGAARKASDALRDVAVRMDDARGAGEAGAAGSDQASGDAGPGDASTE